jgi:hypothetical protein
MGIIKNDSQLTNLNKKIKSNLVSFEDMKKTKKKSEV